MDKRKILIYITYSVFLNYARAYLQTDIINAYFNEKFVKYGMIMGCFSKTEQIRLLKDLSNNLFISMLSVNKINIRESLRNDHHVGTVIDADCKQAEELIKQCGDLELFDVKHHWLILSSTKNVTGIFRQAKVYINADIHIATPLSENNFEDIVITDFYNPSSVYGGKYVYNNLGHFTKNDGYQARMRISKYWKRKNMTGITFKTMVVLPEPFDGDLLDYLKNDDHREINTFNRFHSSVMHVCRQYYNFSMDILLSKSWGYLANDGTFDGLVGALERKRVDFGLSPLFVRTDRAQRMEYGRLTWVLRAAFIFRNPKSKTSVEIFLQPLSMSAWLVTVLAGTISILALRVTLHQEKISLRNNHIDDSWSLLLISVVGAMCQQGLTRTPSLISGRIITLFIFLLFLVIYQFYSASIVSHLLMKLSTSIKNIHDILLSTMEVGCEDILYNRDYFLYTTDTTSRELYLKKIYKDNNQSNFISVQEGIARVEKGNYAFHVELATAYPLIEKHFELKEICELREVQMYKTQPMHSNVQRHSPYRDLIDTCLQKLAEDGILYREIKHWHPRKPECIQSANSKTFNIGFNEFYPALLALGIGIWLSLILLLIEIHVHRRRLKKKKLHSCIVYPFVN